MQKKKAVFNWSGGKDSAHALWKIMQSDEYEILFLLTTVNQETTRSTMHGIPMELLQAQSRSIGIPLKIIGLRPRGDMDDYNRAMTEAVEELKAMGITHFIFGDIFLYDVMQYRKRQLEPMGIQVVEPLWGKNTVEVMDDFLQTRLKTIIVTTMHDGLGKKLSEKPRCRIHRFPSLRLRPQRRKRRIPHLLLRRSDIFISGSFPPGRAFHGEL